MNFYYGYDGYYLVKDWTKLIEKQNIYYMQSKQGGF